MKSRRQFLFAAGATLTLGACASRAQTLAPAPLPPAPTPPPPPSAAEQVTTTLDRFFEQALDDSPQLVTQLGLDKGDRAQAKFRLDDASLADKERDRALNTAQLNALKAIDRSQLSGMPLVNYDSVMFGLETGEEASTM